VDSVLCSVVVRAVLMPSKARRSLYPGDISDWNFSESKPCMVYHTRELSSKRVAN